MCIFILKIILLENDFLKNVILGVQKTVINSNPTPHGIINTNSINRQITGAEMTEYWQAAVLALGPYVKQTNKVQVAATSFDTTVRDEMMKAVGSSTFWDRFWDAGKSLLYIALAVAGLFVVVKTFKRTSEEFVPTGMTVGEIMASGLAPDGVPLPTVAAAGVPVEAGAEAGQSVESDSQDDDVEMITEEKKKLVMDFGLGEEQPERVTVEVLKDLIAEKPDKMSKAARSWLLSGGSPNDNP